MEPRPQRHNGRRAARSQRIRNIWRLACAALLLAGLATVIGSSPASAEVQNPRQTWMRQATAGLFLHWGMRTAPGYTDCAQWEQAVTDGGWDPNY